MWAAPVRRLPPVVFALFAACFALVIAVAVGRQVEPRIMVSPQAVIRDDVIYQVTDLSRHITIERTLHAPGVIDAAWVSEPPLLLQRVRDSRAASYTLSELDPLGGTLRPIVRLTTGANVMLFPLSFVLRRTAEGAQAAVYLPNGEIWTTDPGHSSAKLLATVEEGLQFPLQWSPDGATLSVKATRIPVISLVNVSDGHVRRLDAPLDSWPVWSPDSRYILLNTQRTISENAPIRVIDVQSGTIASLTSDLSGRVARWCDPGAFMYVVQVPVGMSEVRITDVRVNQTRTVMQTSSLMGQVVLSTAPVRGHGCDWLLVSARHFNQQGTRMYLLNRATGDAHLLGIDVQVMEVTPELLVYDLVLAGIRTRKTFSLAASRP